MRVEGWRFDDEILPHAVHAHGVFLNQARADPAGEVVFDFDAAGCGEWKRMETA